MPVYLMRNILLTLTLTLLLAGQGWSKVDRLRVMWRQSPATSMVIGWDQLSGSHPELLFDLRDHGQNADAYRQREAVDKIVPAKGMRNHFVRLQNLVPNTIYYFVIVDSEGVSRRYSFRTAPANPNERLSIIAGGDSRNFREARRNANKLVGKLRPHFVMFGGDMTGGDTDPEWREWMDDWQYHISRDGRLTPIVVARGNHENNNQTLVDLFDIPNPEVYYAFNFGGELLRIYTLNTMIATGGRQKEWLEEDLKSNGFVTWKFAQYHHPVRPHTSKKPEKDELYYNWVYLFDQYKMNLAVESDAHVVKSTWPVRPSRNSGADEGFVRNDNDGIVFIGEGCWGAPLRANDDDKSWTRSSGSFNQFKWIFVDRSSVEIRTIMTDGADRVGEVSDADLFATPLGLGIWNPPSGDVIVLRRRGEGPFFASAHPNGGSSSASKGDYAVDKARCKSFSTSNKGGTIGLEWESEMEQLPLTYDLYRRVPPQEVYQHIHAMVGRAGTQNTYTYEDKGVQSLDMGTLVEYKLVATTPSGNQVQLKATGRVKPATSDQMLTCVPGTERVNVPFSLNAPGTVKIMVLNEDRQVVKRFSYPPQLPGDQERILELYGVPPGKYYIIVTSKGKGLIQYVLSK